MDSKKLIRKLWKMFPLKIAKKYHDYVGLMVSHVHESTNKIVLCLDVSNEVISQAINEKADLIISHHPFIYGKKKFVLNDPLKKEMYEKLEKANIPVYSFHTNFDEGKNGMNDALAQKLELNDIAPINNLPMARKGKLSSSMDVHDFVKYALEKLNLDYGQLLVGEKKIINMVGILGGAGSREYSFAYEDNCDIYISGDTPYHIRKEIIEKKLTYLNLDHEVEKIFISQMKKILLSIDETLQIIEVDDVVQAEIIIK